MQTFESSEDKLLQLICDSNTKTNGSKSMRRKKAPEKILTENRCHSNTKTSGSKSMNTKRKLEKTLTKKIVLYLVVNMNYSRI